MHLGPNSYLKPVILLKPIKLATMLMKPLQHITSPEPKPQKTNGLLSNQQHHMHPKQAPHKS